MAHTLRGCADASFRLLKSDAASERLKAVSCLYRALLRGSGYSCLRHLRALVPSWTALLVAEHELYVLPQCLRVAGAVCAFPVTLLGLLPGEFSRLFQFLVDHLDPEAPAVQQQALMSLCGVSRAHQLSPAVHQLLQQQICGIPPPDPAQETSSAPAPSLLCAHDAGVRAAALRMLCVLGSARRAPLCAVLAISGKDEDHRVRQAALEGLLRLFRKGALDCSVHAVFGVASEALTDAHPNVRLKGMLLLWVFNFLSEPRTSQSTAGVFDQFCSMLKDNTVAVKMWAARLLGRVQSVREDHLILTFAQEQVIVAPLATAEDKYLGLPGHADAARVQSWAVGAFVGALEDEFQEVRLAAIQSICSLSLLNRGLQEIATDFLFDMFNDEIDAVRVASILAVARLCTHFTVTEAQLATTLSNILDSSEAVREATYYLLQCMQLPSPVCVLSVVAALSSEVQKLREGPGDGVRPGAGPRGGAGPAPGCTAAALHKRLQRELPHIFATVQRVAISHCTFTPYLVEDLLRLGGPAKFLLQQEPVAGDMMYTLVMIYLMNSAAHNCAVLPLLPGHCAAQYPRFCRRWPAYFLDIPFAELHVPNHPVTFTAQLRADDGEAFLPDCPSAPAPRAVPPEPRTCEAAASDADRAGVEAAILRCCQQIQRLWPTSMRPQALRITAGLCKDPCLSPPPDIKCSPQMEMYGCYMQVLVAFLRCQGSNVPTLCRRIQTDLCHMLLAFVPLDAPWRLHLYELRATAALWLLLHRTDRMSLEAANAGRHAALPPGSQDVAAFQQLHSHIRDFCQTHALHISSGFAQSLSRLPGRILNPQPPDPPLEAPPDVPRDRGPASAEPSAKRRCIDADPLAADMPVPMPQALCGRGEAIRKVHCAVTVPPSSEDRPLSFCSDLPFSLVVYATVHNHHYAPRPGTLAVVVAVPSHKRGVFAVQAEHIQYVQPYTYKLSVPVQVQAAPWSGAAPVWLVLVATTNWDGLRRECVAPLDDCTDPLQFLGPEHVCVSDMQTLYIRPV